jgi:predicted TPR repeat methyltransferase
LHPSASKASQAERDYIAAMSRSPVVTAYAQWVTLSRTEEVCLSAAFSKGCSVLDLGCGAGRLALRVRNDASKYVGVDASEEMLAVARGACPGLAFVRSDLLDFETDDEGWDAILLMGNVLDYLQPLDRRDALIGRCKAWLKSGGAIVGSSHLVKPGQSRGYYAEHYHGAIVENYRASFGEIISEVEAHGLEVALAYRDDRAQPADWCYWVARSSA